MSSGIKPTLDEVLAYAEPNLKKFIAKLAVDLPLEQKEEILQEGYIRILHAYESLEPDSGWKSFVYNHARGAVLDYLKSGTGFAESRWTLTKPEDHESRNVNKISSRVDATSEEGDSLGIDYLLGINGVVDVQEDQIKIRWELVARMASQDKGINSFARYIKGFSIEEIAYSQGVCRARMGQILEDFVQRFDDPANNLNPWFLQTCYAFGLCNRLGFEDKDLGLGWSLRKVDIDNTVPLPPGTARQLSLWVEMDGEEESQEKN